LRVRVNIGAIKIQCLRGSFAFDAVIDGLL
jgi:hypothetical protein